MSGPISTLSAGPRPQACSQPPPQSPKLISCFRRRSMYSLFRFPPGLRQNTFWSRGERALKKDPLFSFPPFCLLILHSTPPGARSSNFPKTKAKNKAGPPWSKTMDVICLIDYKYSQIRTYPDYNYEDTES